MMFRNALLFCAAVLLALTAGRAFWVTLGEYPFSFVNVPNEQVATRNPAALPSGYEVFLRRWWEWHQVRLVAMFMAMCIVFAAMLTRARGA